MKLNIIIGALISMLIGVIGTTSYDLYSQSVSKTTPTPSPTYKLPTPTITLIRDTITQPVYKEVSYPTPTYDPDPFGNCNISQRCGGGTRWMRKSQCESSVCCELNQGWTFMNKDACVSQVNAEIAGSSSSNSNYNYSWPTITPFPSFHIPTNNSTYTQPTYTPEQIQHLNNNYIDLVNQCKQSCIQNTINMIDAGLVTDTSASAFDKLNSQCMSSCEK